MKYEPIALVPVTVSIREIELRQPEVLGLCILRGSPEIRNDLKKDVPPQARALWQVGSVPEPVSPFSTLVSGSCVH